MKKARIAVVVILGIMLVSGLACGPKEWLLLTYTEGQGVISPSGGYFSDLELVTLSATPESGWRFDHWGEQASGPENPINVIMDSDRIVSAHFIQLPIPTPTSTPTPTPTPTPKPKPTSIPIPTPTPISEWIGPHGEKEVEIINYTTGPLELRNNPEAVNPTWMQLKQFLQADITDQNYYVPDSFVCMDFAGMLHNNAEEAGIITAFISIDLTGSEGHACNGFETIDRGFLYIDVTGTQKQDNYPRSCSADKQVNVVIGQKYIPESIFPCPGWYSTWESIGTVTDIDIKW